MRNMKKIEFVNPDRFKPKLYADLYIPSWVNGYSIAMEYIHNWFLSKFGPKYFKTVHIIGKNTFDDFRRFEYGDYVKREKPAVSFSGAIQYDYDFENIDIHQLGIDGFVKRTDHQRSFFKDHIKKLYLGIVPEAMVINFNIRTRFDTRAEQLDAYKRMDIMFRIGCTETIDTDMDFHIPYKLMIDLAVNSGHLVNDGVITRPYDFLLYLNRHSQIPFLYKLRYINGKYEYFIRMNNMPLMLDLRNKIDPDDGEQDGQTSTNYHLEMQVIMTIPVPKFYVFYAEGKTVNEIAISEKSGIDVFSMKVFDIPDVNNKGWPEYGTSNYIKDENEDIVKEIDITEMFMAPVDIRVGISLEDLIVDSIKSGISPSSFIDIQIYTNDMMTSSGKLPVSIDWDRRKILLPDNIYDNYFYIIIYTELGYINSKIIDINNIYKNRIINSKKTEIDRSEDKFVYDKIIENKEV